MSKTLSDYHRSLKQYLNVSSEELTPETSTRVIKGRAKLSKLTSSQFYDLATDVYDELQRRLDERSDSAGYLIPTHNYHPKRNQARQKLATLASTRFKDLVNDVLFEIEHRETVHSPVTDHQQNKAIANAMANKELKTPMNETFEEHIANEKTKETPSQREIKTSTVVPKKSQLSWSSDEEGSDDEASKPKANMVPGSASISSKRGVDNSSLKATNNNYISSPQKSIRSNHSNNSNSAGLRQNDMNLNGYSSRSPILERNRSVQSRISNKENDTKTLLEESAKMDQEITRLQKQLVEKEKLKENLDFEIDSLTKENELLNKELTASKQTILELQDYKTKHQEVSKQLDSVTFENEDLQKSLDNHLNESNIKNAKYEALLSDYNSLNEQHGKALDSHSETRQGFIQKIDELNKEIKSLRENQTKELNNKSLSLEEKSKIEDYDILNNKYQSLQRDHDNLVASHSDVSKELNLVKSRVPQNVVHNGSSTSEESANELKTSNALRKQVQEWQEKYDAIRADKLTKDIEHSLSKKELDTFVSSSGAVPMSLVTSMYSSAETFIDYVASDNSDVSILFSRAAALISAAEKIGISTKMNSNPLVLEKVTNIKSLSTALLASVRKYSIYQKFTPKNIIYRPVEELYFTVCELVSFVKIKADGDYNYEIDNTRSERSLKNFESEKSIIQEPTTPERATTERRENLTIDTSSSPMVRPLRMAQKLNSPVPDNADSKPKSFGNAMKGIPSMRSLSPIQVQPSNTTTTSSSAAAAAPTANVNVTPKKTPVSVLSKDEQNQRSSPPRNGSPSSPSNSIAEKMKRLQQNSEVDLSKPKEKVIIGSNSNSAFDKFGAKRRSNSIDSRENINSSPIKQSIIEPVPKSAKSPNKTTTTTTDTTTAISNPMFDDGDSELEQTPEPRAIASDNNRVPPSSSDRTIPSAGSALDYREEEEVFNIENFNTLNPDNTLQELLSYLEHQTHEVIQAIQILLESIRDPKATKSLLRGGANEIIKVVKQMSEGTTTLMTQARYQDSIGHAKYVVATLEDCVGRMEALYNAQPREKDHEYAEKSFKQRSAGLAFDVAKSTKELVKTVEEASLKDEIAIYDDRLKK